MAEKRSLSDILKEVLGAPFPDGKNHLYFEPPSSTQMLYPCVRYSYNNDRNVFADDKTYLRYPSYTITVIDRDCESQIAERMKELRYCTLDRKYSADDLNHWVFTLYFKGPRIKEEKENGKTEMGPGWRKKI